MSEKVPRVPDTRPRALVTGNSSGLGRGLTRVLLDRGWTLYGISRRGCDLDGDIRDIRGDLSEFDLVPRLLDDLLDDVPGLDLVVLNAGVLGEIRAMHEQPVAEVARVMDVNCWANKVVPDWLHGWRRPVGQIVAISSGASVLGNRGWGGYALSKAALNMLVRLYSHEFPETHLSALAPGLIDSAMMDYLCEEPDPGEFPALLRIRDARGTDVMPAPTDAAMRIVGILPRLKDFPSGSYVDIRRILDPEAYEELMKAADIVKPRG